MPLEMYIEGSREPIPILDLMTPREVAEALSMPVSTVCWRARHGLIPHLRGTGRSVRIPTWWVRERLKEIQPPRTTDG